MNIFPAIWLHGSLQPQRDALFATVPPDIPSGAFTFARAFSASEFAAAETRGPDFRG
jgi:hypothetical protein